MEVSQTPMVRTMTSSTLNVIFLSIKITLKGGIEFKFYNSYQLGPKNPCIYGIGYKEQIYNSSPKKKKKKRNKPILWCLKWYFIL